MIEETLEYEEEDDFKCEMGANIALNQTIQKSINSTNIKYSRPNYNPQSRKQFYDDGKIRKKVLDDAFSQRKKVIDPYSGAELVKKQRDAKIQFGEKWQSHVAEADHIDPLSKLVDRTKNNPFLTTDDIREIGNNKDNFQVLSRKLNQGSREVGKGGSTQKEWAEDSTRMRGLENNIQSGESVNNVVNRIKKTGKLAEDRNNNKIFRRSVNNAMGTVHDAGKVGAQNAGVTALTMSSIMNLVSVIKGEKSGEDAVIDTIKDGGKAAVVGYAMGGGMTAVSQTLSYSSSGIVQSLAKNNVPGKVITALIMTGDTLKKWGDGEITTQECFIQLGNKGLNMATMSYSMAVGQAMIPIPIIGGAIGALVGATLTGNLYNGLINKLQIKELEHQERLRIMEECRIVKEQAIAFQKELESYLDSYFSEYRSFFDTAISSMQVSYELGDTDGVIAGANSIKQKLGGQVRFESLSEFKAFLDSDEEYIL